MIIHDTALEQIIDEHSPWILVGGGRVGTKGRGSSHAFLSLSQSPAQVSYLDSGLVPCSRSALPPPQH